MENFACSSSMRVPSAKISALQELWRVFEVGNCIFELDSCTPSSVGTALNPVDNMKEKEGEDAHGGNSNHGDFHMAWGAGGALKRSTSSEREATANGKQNGSHIEHVAREAVQLNFRSKSGHIRSFKGDTRHDGWSSWRNNLDCYMIAISLMAICFMTITLMQGSDFLPIPGPGADGDREGGGGFESFPSYAITFGMQSISDRQRAVGEVVKKFTDTLESRSASLPFLRKLHRKTRRPARLALICPNLGNSLSTLYLSTVARGLQWLGYGLELYAFRDGHLRAAWEQIGVHVQLVAKDWQNITVDWSDFEGVIAISLDAKKIVESLAQEPFTEIPLIWIVPETLVLDEYVGWNTSAELQTVYRSWLQAFNRSSALVYLDYNMPTAYADFYNEKFYVIPGTPEVILDAERFIMTRTREELREKFGLGPNDFAVVITRSACTDIVDWREDAIVMKAVSNITSTGSSEEDGLRLYFVGNGNSTVDYKENLQMMAQHVGLEESNVNYVEDGGDLNELLWLADAVVFSSVWEELSFPSVVLQAMALERPIIVPNLDVVRQHIADRDSGFLFGVGDHEALGAAVSMVRSDFALARAVAAEGRSLARSMFSKEAMLEYGFLLEKLLDFPEEAQLPESTADLQKLLPRGWRWEMLDESRKSSDDNDDDNEEDDEEYDDGTVVKGLAYLASATDLRFVANDSMYEEEEFSLEDMDLLPESDWGQEETSAESIEKEQVEEDAIKDRIVDPEPTTFEAVSKMVKKTETQVSQGRHADTDIYEVERISQPLCIYEPYRGSGAWPFLHQNHLYYRGLSLSSEERRPFMDDVDGASRLGLLNDSYYRDVLCDVAGFFAMAKLIDRVHWNPWIGFQPWSAVSQKAALTPTGEAALLEAVSGESHGDALYFWALPSLKDSRVTNDFWASCDAANAGNCRTAFLNSFREMYGLPSTWTAVPPMPPMPEDRGVWAAMHCWAMPTTSFLEFVMFLRMFVSALDALQYNEHHDRGDCCFKSSKLEAKHCYCDFLEGLVNVWAYHSGRRMIYLDPGTGTLKEQHFLEERAGSMWLKWFDSTLLKSMDEDLAEESEDQSHGRWLWPRTGEVLWAGTKEKERRERFEAKVEKKRAQLERQARQSKYKQQALGDYVKPKKKRYQRRRLGWANPS